MNHQAFLPRSGEAVRRLIFWQELKKFGFCRRFYSYSIEVVIFSPCDC
jgi:hypothetical protein